MVVQLKTQNKNIGLCPNPKSKKSKKSYLQNNKQNTTNPKQLTLKKFNLTNFITQQHTSSSNNDSNYNAFPNTSPNVTINSNSNNSQQETHTPLFQENSTSNNITEAPLAITKLINEQAIKHAKIQCAISNYKAQIKSINLYKNNPESSPIPLFLKFKITQLLKSNYTEEDIQHDIDRTLLNSFNSKNNKLLELENINRNYVVNFWNVSILPALQFANYGLNYETFSNIYDAILKNTKFNFFITQTKHQQLKALKSKQFDLLKEDKLQPVTLTKGDLTKITNKLNQLALSFNKTKTNHKQATQIKKKNYDNSKKDPGRRVRNRNSIFQNNSTNIKPNGKKSNTATIKK